MSLDPADRARVLDPPLQTARLPGVGGRLRARAQDFRVEEVPAYPADGREGHLLLVLEKTGLTTEDAVAQLARQLGISRADIGVAGLKDKDAVTRQWISLPGSAAPGLDRFSHEQITLGPAHAHGNKLRRGHLRGNRFEIVVRELAVDHEEAVRRIDAKLAALAADHGLDDYFGPQRFGRDGDNVERGLAALSAGRGRRKPRADFLLSAGQAVLFNLLLALRRERGLARTVLAGDVLKKTETGGLFVCDQPAVDQARLDAGELVITGPMFGSKMRAPGSDSPAAALELEVLACAGIDPQALAALGRRAPGTRRPLNVELEAVRVAATPAIAAGAPDDRGPASSGAVCLSFSLPAGAYATSLLRELMSPTP